MIKGILSWVNPTQYVDGTPLDTSAVAGYEISYDGIGAVGVPLHGLGTTFDMNSLDAYTALKHGPHSVAIDIVMSDGSKSAFSNAVTFPVVSTPNPPSSLSVV